MAACSTVHLHRAARRLPLQVNKIRDLGTAEHKHMVVTHTDAKETYVWNMDTQASHHRGPKVPSTLDPKPSTLSPEP